VKVLTTGRLIQQRYDKFLASARSVDWGMNEALTLLYLVAWPIAVMCNMPTQVSGSFLLNATDQNLH